MKMWVIILILLTSMACAHTPVIVKIRCPESPKMLPVEVRDGKLDKEDVSKVIKNHQTLWEYIHRLQKLGCKKGR